MEEAALWAILDRVISNRHGTKKTGLQETAASTDLPFVKDMIIYNVY